MQAFTRSKIGSLRWIFYSFQYEVNYPHVLSGNDRHERESWHLLRWTLSSNLIDRDGKTRVDR